MAKTSPDHNNKSKANPAAGTKKSAAAGKKPAKSPSREQPRQLTESSALIHQIIPFVLGLLGLLIGLCLVWADGFGFFGRAVRWLLFGGFATGAALVPFLFISMAVFWKRSIDERNTIWRIIIALVCLISLSVLLHVFQNPAETFDPLAFGRHGLNYIGGGMIGGMVGFGLSKLFGGAGTVIISLAVLAVFSIFLVGMTPYGVWIRIRYYWREWMEERKIEKEMERQVAKEAAMAKQPPKAKLVHEPVHTPAAAPAPSQTPAPAPAAELPPASRKKKRSSLLAMDTEITDPEPEEEEETETVQAAEEPQDIFDEESEDISQLPADTEPDDVVDQGAYAQAESDPDNADDDQPPFDVEEPVGEKDEPDPEKEPEEAGPLSEEMIRRLTETKVIPSTDGSESLEVTCAPAVEELLPEAVEPDQPEYSFPPITLLEQGSLPDNTDISDELQTTAKRLVDTLASFKVKAKIVNVSRGPTITRYEVAPEAGVRVRSIIGLVDDIALNLAASGVRIEPVPGKQAVGVEVPNQVVSTVYLRRLIENPQFSSAGSRITVCLGEDVAGDPVYLDIAKMPHLLIAGATGMGKSVCINSMIVSLLYKASPDEVKLIMIDPKKVELNIYSGLPHLLVPVVSEPKKAAGALQWAVNEMERRFTLIEEVGMRDLKGYNNAVREDPQKEFLPHIVIIIDELADLMMTARDSVEDSICRLAQKARAAGMHLIIGTQRPSVDVITGLIKANVPSRIAFTMASQMDSRTVIDIGGAEKLIGRGDMLYKPVNLPKPVRVQGAFVSEGEIDGIMTHIKTTYGVSKYDDQVIESINAEAERCDLGKKGAAMAVGAEGGEDGEGGDPMLKAAIGLAVESGKISTSLIQRKLSLGYGRSAKLIDRMQEMGIVSAPEGQKPRTVLITKEQFMEMSINNEIE